MRSRRGLAVAVALGLACACGCELVSGFTGDVKLGRTGGTGANATSSASTTTTSTATTATTSTGSTAATSSSTATSGTGGNGGTSGTGGSDGGTGGAGAGCTVSCSFGQPCTADAQCATGYCNGKTCDAQTLVSGLSNPNSLAVDYWGLYWADGVNEVIWQADLATLTMEQLVASTNPQGLTIAQGCTNDPSILAWVEPGNGNVLMVVPPTPGQTPTPVATGQASPAGVVLAPDTVPLCGGKSIPRAVWTVSGGLYYYDNSLQQAATFMGPGGRIALVPGGSPGCTVIVYAAGGVLTKTSFVEPMTTASCTPTTVMATGTQIVGIAADATNAYWSDGKAPGSVYQAPLSSLTPTVIAPNQPGPTEVAVDAQDVYWINTVGTGEIVKAPIGGGAPTTVLASGQETPRGLFITSTAVYWIAGMTGNSAIKKILK